MKSILIIDDNESFRQVLSMRLAKKGYRVQEVGDGPSGLKCIEQDYFDIIITDLVMDRMDGIQIIQESQKLSPSSVILLITAYSSVDTAVKAIKAGAYDYITKESDLDEILIVIERALEKKGLVDKIQGLEKQIREQFDFQEIIGSSPLMINVLQMVSRVSKTTATVLITGASGTGKELVGKAIHYNSTRKDKPLVTLNCGAIPESLQESELFGHRKGAFTGAMQDKKGLIEEANGGTLILDEVGELSQTAQVKLLRFLQNKEVRSVGDTQTKTVDVRIIAMTNRDLETEIENHNFREDLFYRLNVVPISLPSLAERPEDLELLMDHFLINLQKKLHQPKLSISTEAVRALKSYHWPGNIRELENVLERCAILCNNNVIGVTDLPADICNHKSTASTDFINTQLSLQDIERQYILSVLSSTGGNKSQAADILQISRPTLISKLKSYQSN